MHKLLRRGWFAVFLAAGVLGLLLSTARAWWVIGHGTITEAAALALPDEVPGFYRAAGRSLAHFAGDPDRWKNPRATYLKLVESPNHFIDLEDLEGNPMPADRFQAAQLFLKLNKGMDKVGYLPWAIMEGFDKLSVAFYDYRQEPSNPAVPMKCLVHGGTLAHYTTDASMPLHTTRDYDGRVQPGGGRKKQQGIHAKLDAFPEKFGFKAEEVTRGLEAKPIDNIWEYVNAFIKESSTHIDKSYELDAAGAFDTPTDASRAFVMARCKAGAQFTLDIWYNAWLRSAKLPAHY
jgi:hypothetical protein